MKVAFLVHGCDVSECVGFVERVRRGRLEGAQVREVVHVRRQVREGLRVDLQKEMEVSEVQPNVRLQGFSSGGRPGWC